MITSDSVTVYVDGLGKVIVSLAMANRLRKLGRFTYAPDYRSTWIPIDRKTSVQRFINGVLLDKLTSIQVMQV